MDNNEVLLHFGKKGMKWGVRKDSKTPSSADSQEASELRKKPVNQLSNAQLKTVNSRRQLEQQFTKLNPNTVSRGKNAVKATIATAGTAAALYNLAKSPAGQAALTAGKKWAKPFIIGYRANKAFR